jgi:hypothetical protein
VIKKGDAIFKAKSVDQAIKFLEDELDLAFAIGGMESNEEPIDEIWA